MFVFRLFRIKQIPKDKVDVVQKAELRSNFVLTRDQYELKIYKQISEKSDIVIIGIHNFQGQKDDFKLISSLCKQKQWSLISFDRRGMGKNRQDWKFNSLNTDINDIKDVVGAVKDKFANQKIFLMAEGFGATIAANACKNNKEIDGLISINLITKSSLYPYSLKLFLIFFFGFFFNSNIKLPFNIEPEDISSSQAYITNMKQRYTLKQLWPLKFLLQFQNINKKAPKIICNLNQSSLIIQSGDDVFSDFHQLKILNKKWKNHQNYHFVFSGKHAFLNETEIKDVFEQKIYPWINNLVKDEERY